jgi:hypothetical protein
VQALTPDQSTVVARLADSLHNLEDHLRRERYRGYDPYDALTSPLFRLPVLRSSKWIRVAAEQALKRLPYNVRPLLGIRKGYNPVTLAFVLEGCAYLAHADSERSDTYRDQARDLVKELERLRSSGSGACWGYDFPWEARYGALPAGAPTIVATGLVANALFTSYRLLGLDEAFALCEGAARFVLEDVPRLPGRDGTFCWAYFPADDQRVLNATMKGARVCAQVYSVTGDESYLHPAAETARYVAGQQRADGSWPYAVGDRRGWTDNFHTAYVLDAFDEYQRYSGDDQFHDVLQRGWRYYRQTFFADDAIPKYYADQLFPVDATACAQAILTLCRFEDVEAATRVAQWTVENMQCDDGHFAYQQRRRRLVRIPYMRWSSAYMFLALSRLLFAHAGGKRG